MTAIRGSLNGPGNENESLPITTVKRSLHRIAAHADTMTAIAGTFQIMRAVHAYGLFNCCTKRMKCIIKDLSHFVSPPLSLSLSLSPCSGLDVVGIVEYLNLGDSVLASKTGAGASTFVIAYAVHKVFAPVRISITLGATPFLVRMMRKRGILKKKN